MAYATTTDVQGFMPGTSLGSTTDATYTTALTNFIAVASLLVDNYVGRWSGFFVATTDDQTRWFDGPDASTDAPGFLRIDECTSVTSVSIAEDGDPTDLTATATDDYFLWPHNYGNLSVPIRALILDRLNGDYADWPPYPKAVKVVGKFGYSAAAPVNIKLAVCMQVVRWLKRFQAAMQTANAIPELGTLTYSQLDPDIQELIRPYVVELSE